MPLPVISDASTLRIAAQSCRGPFIWFPPSRRATAPTAAKLAKEYKTKAGNDGFLLGPSGAGGVYPPETSWLIPQGVGDSWVRHHLGGLVTITPTIPAPPGNVFYHTGDLGDIIAALPIMRHLGGGRLVIGNHQNPAWRPMAGMRYESLRPLLETADYLKGVSFEHAAEDVTHDFSAFRSEHRKDRTLTESQAAYLQIEEPISMEPWLVAPAHPMTRGKIVVARSARYQNPAFPWRDIGRIHAQRIAFIGTADEHAAFQGLIGQQVPFLRTDDFRTVASLIAGSEIFIGNQSSPCWVAMALGHTLIQETHPSIQDSRVIRPNAQFFEAGKPLLPPPGLSFKL